MKPYYVPTYSGFMLPCNLFISIYNPFLQGQLTLWNQSRKSKTNFGYLHGMCWNDDSWICSVRNCLFNEYLCTYVHFIVLIRKRNTHCPCCTHNYACIVLHSLNIWKKISDYQDCQGNLYSRRRPKLPWMSYGPQDIVRVIWWGMY